ncbi:hypothetical protein CEP52_014772 [Fusarium oligoseptatum]|uniref:Uncharacterized protein n=1 Tax=Fusarium oligoseptatum TaxID=2604345 RepID=A0A428SJ74_9HYPO|nr:hypothetical protein CEP52_014772 [Fusarium oligoseptatum]
MTQNKPLSWWVVRLYCVQGNWLRFPLQLSSTSATRQRIQDEVEHTSHETRYSDAEIYRLIRKYMRSKDNRRELECRERLTPYKFPGVIGGLQLSNVHKHLALHIDEQISHYLRHILKVWDDITGDDSRVTIFVDLETVKCLQFRAPSTSDVDRLAIKRMFSDGTLFRELRDLDLRDVVRDRVLSVQGIIPSLQTFHENMKYISMGAKFLRKHFITPLQDKQLGTPTLFQRLARDWSDPGAYYVEVADEKLEAVPTGRATAYRAYKHLFISALRNFARVTTNPPRQDVRGETMPSFPEKSRIRYLSRLAGSLGFDNANIQEALDNQDGHPSIPDYVPEAGTPADWRGGIPFTKTYLSLQSLAFPPQLDTHVAPGKSPSPLFVMQDIINAFFERTETLGPGPRPHFPDEGSQHPDGEDLYSATDNEGDVTMRGPLNDRVGSKEEDDAATRRSRSNVLGPRSSRIFKGRRRSRHGRASRPPNPDGQTMFRQLRRSPQLLSEDMEAWLRAPTLTGGDNRSIASHQPAVPSSIPSSTEYSPTLREPRAARQPPHAARSGEPSAYRSVSGTLPDDFTTVEDPGTWREPQAAREPRETVRSIGQAPADASVKGGLPGEYETVGSLDPITLRQPQAAKQPEGMTHPLGRVSANSSVGSESLSVREAVELGQTRMDQAERPVQSKALPKSPATLREPRTARQAPSLSGSTIEQGSAIREHPAMAELAQPDTLREPQAGQEDVTAMEGVATLNFGTTPASALRPIPPIRRMKPQRRSERRPQRRVPVRARISLMSQGSRSQYSQDSRLSQASLPSQYSQDSDYYSRSTGVGPPPPKRPRLDDDN